MDLLIVFLKSIYIPAIGAIISIFVGYLFNPDDFNISSYEFIATVVVGAIVGWFTQIVYDMRRIIDEYDHRLSEVQKSFNYQGKILKTFLSDMRHDEVINDLVTDSVEENFSNIPFVNINGYFSYLSKALKQSNNFQGILDKPIGWYQENSNQSSSYLKNIKAKEMFVKRRIFFIRNEDVEKMEKDLSDPKKLEFYWENTGDDMDSYWITEGDFDENLRGKDIGIPKDSVLFDNQLYIEYSYDRQTLSFKVLEPKSDDRELKIFNELEKQIRMDSFIPFRKIPKEINVDSKILPSVEN